MTIDEAVAAKLASVLADLVGDRVYPDAYPQPADGTGPQWPCAVYSQAADDTPGTLDGTVSALRVDAYTVEVWSGDGRECEAGRDLLRAAFRGANCRGRWGGAGGLFVCGAVARNAEDAALPPVQGDEELDRVKRLTLTVTWKAGT